jgi:RNase P subunit RPR2
MLDHVAPHGIGELPDLRAGVRAQCKECREVWLPGDAERWQAYWIDDGPEEKLVFYCAACAEREFGSSY